MSPRELTEIILLFQNKKGPPSLHEIDQFKKLYIPENINKILISAQAMADALTESQLNIGAILDGSDQEKWRVLVDNALRNWNGDER